MILGSSSCGFSSITKCPQPEIDSPVSRSHIGRQIPVWSTAVPRSSQQRMIKRTCYRCRKCGGDRFPLNRVLGLKGENAALVILYFDCEIAFISPTLMTNIDDGAVQHRRNPGPEDRGIPEGQGPINWHA